MGNGASRSRYEDDTKKVAKWRAELEHVKELNQMLSEERRIVTTSMEQELYDKQVELFYLGKSATKHIGFRGYLKIINKVSPRTQADFMKPDNYDAKKQAPNRTTAMVLRSAILNFSLFALFEAWLLKRMHFVSIQKHQRRLHQKGWKAIVAFYSEEIPLIQEIFEKQEPALRERVEIGKKENMELLEQCETKIFQQEEEILKLRRQLEEMNGGNPRGSYDDMGDDDGDEDVTGERKAKGRPRMSLDQAFPGTTEKHRAFNQARSPVQALIRKMETSNSTRDIGAPGVDRDAPEKGWRTDTTRTWGAEDSEDDTSLYTDDNNNNNNNNNNSHNNTNEDDGDIIYNDKFDASEKLDASEKRSYRSHRPTTTASEEWNDTLLKQEVPTKDPEIAVYSNHDEDAVSAITMPHHATSADSVTTGDSLDGGNIMTTKSPSSNNNNSNSNNNSNNKDDYSVNSAKHSVSNASTGSGGGASLTTSQKNAQQQLVRDKDAIRLERERLQKAKLDRKRRKEMERVERESFYKQERERLQHQEKRLFMKREESVRMRQGRLQDVIVDENASDEEGKSILDIDEKGEDENENQEEFLDALEEHDYKAPSAASQFDENEEDEDELQVRPPRRSSSQEQNFDDDDDAAAHKDDNYNDDDEEEEEVVGLNDLDLGGEAPKNRNSMFSPEHHPSMDTDALFIAKEDKVEKLDRRRMWHKDKADSDRELSADDDDSIGNELKRLEEFETAINADEEEVAASNISDDFKMLRSSSNRSLTGLDDDTPGARSRSRSRSRLDVGRSSSRSRLGLGRSSSRSRLGGEGRSSSRSRLGSARSASRSRLRAKATNDSDEEYEDLDDAAEVRSAPRGREEEAAPVDDGFPSSKRSKSLTKKPRKNRLKDHLEATVNKSDDVSVYSKGSKASKGSKTGKKKKKKKGEARRKLKGTDAASIGVDGEEVVVRKKKKKKKKPKQNDDDQSYYYEDEDMTVTSALTSGSYE
ncbi:MAG: hypothetical protein SGBAC_011383 [Bacillariaceae sp.]